MRDFFRERWMADVQKNRSPSGNMDIPRLIARWASDPVWVDMARRLPPAERRGYLAALGRETYDRDVGRFATELRWNTRRLGYIWSSSERERILRRHAELLFASLSDVLTFRDSKEREQALADVDLLGLEHLRAALSSGRGVIFLSVYQSHPQFFLEHAYISGLQVGVIRHEGNTPDSPSLLFYGTQSRAQLFPASLRAVRPILDLLSQRQSVAFYNDFLYPGSVSIPSPLFGKSVLMARAILSIALKTQAMFLPVAIARQTPVTTRGVKVEFSPPLLFEGRSEARFDRLSWLALLTGIATECLIRRYPAAWRLWNTLELRWQQAEAGGMRTE